VFDAMVGYDFENWSLALNVRNLTDKIYVGRSCDQYSCGYGERRKVVGTATYRW
jgi:iron complex outermembrane receptor protein